MSKIIVEVHVPAAGVRHDLAIPYEVKLWRTAELVRALLADQDGREFIPDQATVFCDAETGAIFNLNLSPEELGLQTGSRLMIL